MSPNHQQTGRAKRPILSRNLKILILVSITVARAIYALNWYTLAPGLTQISRDLSLSSSDLGMLEAAFLVGAGLFQVPSTIGAAKWNPKALCVAGMAVIGASNIFGGYANSFALLVMLRFTLGIGASMFFAPAIAVVSDLFQTRQGLGIGIYNSAFSVGGSFALFGWAYVDHFFTWRGGLIIGGIIALVLALENYIVLTRPPDKISGSSAASRPVLGIKGVLRNKQVWLLGTGIVGVWAAYYVIGQFFPLFQENAHQISNGTASLMTAQIFIWPIPGSLLGGYLSDRLQNRKLFLLIPSVLMAIATAFLGYSNYYETWGLLVLIGLTDSFVFTVLYASVYDMKELDYQQKIMSIALMNSIEISGAFFGPLIYSALVPVSYTVAWLAIGILVLPFCACLALAKEPFHSRS